VFLILFVLHQVDMFDLVLSAWESAGVNGITVLPSTGLGRIREKGALRDDIPLIPSLEDLLNAEREELLNRTMFTITDDASVADKLILATEEVIGSLSKPNSGIMAVLPLAKVYGYKKR
jgi:hypothetical protein